MIIHNATLTGSISMQAPPVISGSLTLTGSINATGDITASSARFSNIITAQTLVVQTVSSSVSYISGSTQFGSSSINTHQFTGSVLITGSMGVGAPSPLSILHVSSSSSTITGKVILQSPSSDSGILQLGSTAGEASMMFIPGVTAFGTSTGVIRTSTYGNAALWGVGPGTYTADPTKFGIANVGIGGNILTVSSSGALGIGTTSPTERLDVVGGGLAAGNGTIRTGITYGTIGLIGTFTNHDLGVITNGTTKLFISASGNVGIGVTPTQTAALTFADSLAQKILLNNNANNYRIDLASAVNGGDAMFKIVAGSSTAGEVGFYTTTNLRMLITSGGNVLIGTTSNSARLTILAATSAAAMRIDADAGQNAISIGGTGIVSVDYPGEGGGRFKVADSGQIYMVRIAAGAGTYAVKFNSSSGEITKDTSSIKYKNNIRDSKYGLSDVLKLRSAMFEYKDSGRTDVGLIAEEVFKIIPELTVIDKEGLPDGVSYDRFISVLVKAIQEMNTKSEEQQATIKSLQERLNKAGL